MADCCNHFSFTDDGDSFESWQGLRGPYFVPHLSADGVLSWTNTGNLPNPAPVDISGPPGSSVELRGPVASVQDLPATASSSELWLVGTASPYDGWFYNGVQWENAGPVAVGPPGPAGPAGPQGETGQTGPAGQDGTDGSNGATFTPSVSSAGVISWTNDGGLPNPESVNIKGPQGETGQTGPAGQDGTDGSNGVTFTPAVSSAGVISWTNDGGLPNPQSVNIKGPQGETGSTGPAGPGVPAGGSTGQVLKKQSATDYATEWGNVGDVTADMLGIVITGNSTPVGAAAGQYVIVKNSTISGITDGLYTAAKAIPANTAIDSTYLTAVSSGGLNDLVKRTNFSIGSTEVSVTINNDVYAVKSASVAKPGKKAILAYVSSCEDTITCFATYNGFNMEDQSITFTIRYLNTSGSLTKTTHTYKITITGLYIDD